MEIVEQNKKLDPTFGSSFSNGWEVMKKYFLVLLLVVIVVGIILSPGQVMRMNINPERLHLQDWHSGIFNSGLAVFGIFAVIFGLFAFAYSLLLVPVFDYGANLMFVHAVRNIRPGFETLIVGFREKYLHIILANLLTFALVMLGCIFLIIPGIIIGCRLAFVSYLVMDKKLDPIIAVEESWKLTKGKGWTIFAMGFVSIFIFIIGVICLIVGVLPAIIWIKASFASLYEAVLLEKSAVTADLE